jgi:hypothetical protein
MPTLSEWYNATLAFSMNILINFTLNKLLKFVCIKCFLNFRGEMLS